MTKRRLVIHNHLPARRAADADYSKMDTEKLKFALGVGEAGLGMWDKKDPAYKEVERAVAEMKAELAKRKGKGGKDAKNLAYEVKVRRLTTGGDWTIRLFAASEEVAEERAKDRARQMERIPLDKYNEYLRAGHAVFRIVSIKVSENQQPYSGNDARDNSFRVKRGDDGNGGVDWFVQSDDEEVVGDKTFNSRSEAEAYARQRQARERSRDAKPSYEDWMKQVDRQCNARSGMSIHDLPDCPFREWYDSNVSAASAAARCVRAAKE